MANTKMTNNKILFGCFLFLSCLTSSAQTENNEILTFKNFDVHIINFISADRPYSENDSTKADTLNIRENACDQNGWYIGGATLKIIPQSVNDSFALSFAYEVTIIEVNNNFNTVNSDSWEDFTYITDYKTISPLSKNKFKIPEFENSGYIKSIKKKYNFQDTLVTGTSESGSFEYRFTKNGKVFGDHWNILCLCIKRFNKGRLIENKYIMVELSDGCD